MQKPDPGSLIDTFGRVHSNLRISVTDRCNIRCFYCMPEEQPLFVPHQEILTFEEIERLVRLGVRLGITKVRLTGGEPLVRRDLPLLVRKLAGVPGIIDLGLTTNGILLPELAAPLYQAGLRRINIHLDTLDPEKFRRIARRDGLDRVLKGIQICRELGYRPIKINAVAVHGQTEADLVPLARFGRENDLVVRFIEFMPLDAAGRWQRSRVLTAEEVLGLLGGAIAPLEPVPNSDPRAPASEYAFADGRGRIGIIASVTRPFCTSCNRIRLTADGKLRNCLFALQETDVKALLRGGAGDEELEQLIRCNIAAKWEGHEIHSARFVQPSRPMYAIGG